MIQSFQCPTCGNMVAIGEPSCTSCGQNFVYNCPVCGNPVDNRYIRCGSCKTLFNWSKPARQNTEINPEAPLSPPPEDADYTDIRQSRVENREIRERTAPSNLNMTSRPMFWLMLIAGCAILIGVLLFISRFI